MNDECKAALFNSSFIIPHSSFLLYPVHPCLNPLELSLAPSEVEAQ
jgi:hypothetical protein